MDSSPNYNSLEELYEACGDAVYRLALRLCRSNQEAPTVRKDVTPLNRKPGGLMEQNNASLQRGDQG
jgi:hypothetical protein